VYGIAQPMKLALLAYGPATDEQWGQPKRSVDFFDVKGDLESLFPRDTLRFERDDAQALHPGRSARVLLDAACVGRIGVLHPAIQQMLDLPFAPVLAELDIQGLLARPVPIAQELPRFPPVVRDLAFVVADAVTAQEMLDLIRDALDETPVAQAIRSVGIFDEYCTKGLENKEKSLAFRVWMQDTRRTLGDAEVADALARVVAQAERIHGARLRG
jgi:phenylalanyl-tRNA synthetase beta chain